MMNGMLAAIVVGVLGAGPAPVKLAPKLAVGQEYCYRGTMVERSGNGAARYEQPFELEASMLVLDVDAFQAAEVGCYTEVRTIDKSDRKNAKTGDGIRSSHFALLKVAPRNVATWAKTDAAIVMPTDGKPVWELGYLLELPKPTVVAGDRWTIKKDGQPNIDCRCVGMETTRGTPCVKIVCTQQTPTWNTPGDRPDWRTECVYWVNPRDASVFRLSRTHEMRRAHETTPSRSIVVDYDQSTAMKLQGTTFQERVADFRAAQKAQVALEAAFAANDGASKARFAAVKQQLKYATSEYFATPYRSAMERMCKLAEQAEANPMKFRPPAPVLQTVQAEVGQKARNFTLHCAATKESITPKKALGRPLLIVMVDPKSHLSWAALHAALGSVNAKPGTATRLVVVCKDNDKAAIDEMKERYPGNYEICTGSGFDRGYGVKGMPHTIFIDAAGILRCNHSGYGPEMCSDVASAVKLHGNATENMGKKEAARGTFLR